jgi:hypothetical protein
LPVCSSQQWRWRERSQYERDPVSSSSRRLVSSTRHPNPNLRTSFHRPLTFFPSLKLTKPPSPNLMSEPIPWHSYVFVTDENWMCFDVYHPSFLAAMATAQKLLRVRAWRLRRSRPDLERDRAWARRRFASLPKLATERNWSIACKFVICIGLEICTSCSYVHCLLHEGVMNRISNMWRIHETKAAVSRMMFELSFQLHDTKGVVILRVCGRSWEVVRDLTIHDICFVNGLFR